MENLKNEMVNGILASRYIASFEEAGGKIIGVPREDKPFRDWLRGLTINGRSLTETEIMIIYKLAQELKSAKLELIVNT